MPPTVQAVLAARLDRLDSAELAIVKAAAVIGESFSDEALLLLAGRSDRSELESHLGALVRKQIIEADGGRFGGRRTFSFKHILLCDVAYQGVTTEFWNAMEAVGGPETWVLHGAFNWPVVIADATRALAIVTEAP